MNRNELVSLVVALIAGGLVGAAYFRGLWWTVKKGVHARRPAALFIGSFIVRTLFALAAFYFIGHGHPERLAICLLGFILGRLITVRPGRLSKHQLFSTLGVPRLRGSEDGKPPEGGTPSQAIHAPEP
jgi:F1F0 ATPase subunit 2